MNHYLYQIVHVPTGAYYVGIRTCRVAPEQDDYWGSGVAIRAARKKYPAEEFRKDILIAGAASRERLMQLEAQVVAADLVADPHCYNLIQGGGRGNYRVPAKEDTRAKMSAARKGRSPYQITEETREKLRAAKLGKKRGPYSAEHRQKIADANAGRGLGEKRGPASEERKEKIAAAQRGVKRGPMSAEHKQKIAASLKEAYASHKR